MAYVLEMNYNKNISYNHYTFSKSKFSKVTKRVKFLILFWASDFQKDSIFSYKYYLNKNAGCCAHNMQTL